MYSAENERSAMLPSSVLQEHAQ